MFVYVEEDEDSDVQMRFRNFMGVARSEDIPALVLVNPMAHDVVRYKYPFSVVEMTADKIDKFI